MLKDIIGILIPDKELAGASIINVSPNSITIKLNQAKTQAFQCFNLIVQYLIDYKKKLAEDERSDKVITSVGLDMPDSPYLNCISDMMPSIISSLEFVSYHQNIDQLMESEYISELFIELLLILNKISSDNRFIQIFNEGYKHIIVNICLPLLKATLADIETFEESPEEFVALSCDICERQESETVKSTAAQLLESLCNRIDGSLRFIINLTFEVVDWTVTHKPLTDYQNLSQFAQSKILQASEELRIEALLLSACIVSYTAGKRKDLVSTIEVLFTTHLNTLYTNGTGIIKNRLCMLIHYYSEYIFITENDSFRSLVLIVLKSCNPQENPISSVNVQASETLSFMLQEEEILMRIYDFIPEMVFHIISIVQYQNSKAFFEALQEIITSNTNLIIPHLAVLIPSLVSKVISETKLRKEKKNKSSILIVKCWNIIRALVECKSLTIGQVFELEQQFIPLFEYIKSPKDIDFDDDIILFEVSVMRRCQTVTAIGWNIFTHLPLVQEKYDNTFVQLFQVLNCYIFYGNRQLVENPNYLVTISEMCGKCLFATYKNKINEATNAEAALIYQQMIFTFKGLLNDILPSILAFAILKLSTVIKNDFFRARVLGIILASFSYDCSFTLEVLNTSQLSSGQTYFDYVFGQISQNSHIFKHPYDKKVAISGLSSFFNNPNLSGTYILVFQLLIEILANTNKDILPLKNLDLNEDSAITYMKESLKEFNSEEMEASLGLTTYLTPLDSFDEYDYFRTLTKNFQQSDLSILIKTLNKPQVEKLTEILQTKKVAINNNTAHTEPRRIVKPKTRINK